jgi:hypothetical protein
MHPTVTKIDRCEILSAKKLLVNINKIKPKCITISSELKTFPIIALSLTLWIMVLEAIITGEITMPRAKARPSATIKYG